MKFYINTTNRERVPYVVEISIGQVRPPKLTDSSAGLIVSKVLLSEESTNSLLMKSW